MCILWTVSAFVDFFRRQWILWWLNEIQPSNFTKYGTHDANATIVVVHFFQFSINVSLVWNLVIIEPGTLKKAIQTVPSGQKHIIKLTKWSTFHTLDEDFCSRYNFKPSIHQMFSKWACFACIALLYSSFFFSDVTKISVKWCWLKISSINQQLQHKYIDKFVMVIPKMSWSVIIDPWVIV